MYVKIKFKNECKSILKINRFNHQYFDILVYYIEIIYISYNLSFFEQHTTSTYMIERIKLIFDEKSAIYRPLYCLHIADCIDDR